MDGKVFKKGMDELWRSSFRCERDTAVDIGNLTDKDLEVFEAGRASGFHEAVTCIYLNAFGAKETFHIWWDHLGEMQDEDKDKSRPL